MRLTRGAFNTAVTVNVCPDAVVISFPKGSVFPKSFSAVDLVSTMLLGACNAVVMLPASGSKPKTVKKGRIRVRSADLKFPAFCFDDAFKHRIDIDSSGDMLGIL